MISTVLAVKETHKDNPDCPMRLAQDPGGHWYCVDCGYHILHQRLEVVEFDMAVRESLRSLASQKCNRSNCGTVCKCGPCWARKALDTIDPEWRP